jgi:NTE family protein
MAERKREPRNRRPVDKQIALVLQGGGALGSYQAGVYQALAEAGCEPDWIAGISIGAINSAIIAGNEPKRRVKQLESFWQSVTSELPFWPHLEEAHWRDTGRRLSALSALAVGQPGFFRPRSLFELGFGNVRMPVSFYDTSDLKATLERMVDFDRINAREIRLSLGAVNVETGNFAYFDNSREAILPEHVMASGALPPGFPPIEIGGNFYWDGGLVSNTPLQYVLEAMPRHSTLAFQVDLFSSEGTVPNDIETVMEREKDIRYSSRTRMGTDTFRAMHNLRRNISLLLAKLPKSLEAEPEVEHLRRAACMTSMDIVQLIYRPHEVQGHSKDYEFSRATMEARWIQGFSDARFTLEAAPWLTPASPEIGVRTFDALRDTAS